MKKCINNIIEKNMVYLFLMDEEIGKKNYLLFKQWENFL